MSPKTTKGIEQIPGRTDELLKSIFETAEDGILYVDTRGKIIIANKKSEDISGYKLEEIVGMHFSKLKAIRLMDMPHLVKIFALAIVQGKTLKRFEIIIIKKDGTEMPTEISTGVVKKGGKLVGITVVVRDISGRKTIEEELKKKNAELESFNKVAVGRELKMIELKKKIQELEEKLNAHKIAI